MGPVAASRPVASDRAARLIIAGGRSARRRSAASALRNHLPLSADAALARAPEAAVPVLGAPVLGASALGESVLGESVLEASVLEASVLEASVLEASVLEASAFGASVFSFCGGFGPPFLESLAYQPEPLSWKPAAVSIFSNDALPHSGQDDSNGSWTFRRYSFWNPQDGPRHS